MDQNQETPLQPQPVEMSSILESTPGDSIPEASSKEQHPKILPLWPALEATSDPKPTTKPKASTTRANWVNTLWADISGQLRRFSVISSDLFDGLLLKKDTYVGSLIRTELRHQYDRLGDNRNLATVRVLTPEHPMTEMWQLYWTIKRPRDPNGRRYHSQTTIGPIDPQTRLDIETVPSRVDPVTYFSLPRFIQDYGPGPSEFDFEPENGFDCHDATQGVMTDVDAGV